MALLKDGEDDEDEKEDALARAGSGPNESKKRAPIAKVPAYGADELRAVIIRRKKEQAEKDRAEKLRQEAYEASLDVPPSASVLGNTFVKQYYNVLLNKPSSLHRFYKDESSLTRCSESGTSETVLGQRVRPRHGHLPASRQVSRFERSCRSYSGESRPCRLCFKSVCRSLLSRRSVAASLLCS